MLSKFPVKPIGTARCTVFVETIIQGDGLGRLKQPMPLTYAVMNCTEKVLDLCVSLESSDTFMNAGPKKVMLRTLISILTFEQLASYL